MNIYKYFHAGHLVDDCCSSSLRNAFKLPMDSADAVSNWCYGVDKFGSDFRFGWRLIWLLYIQV